MPDLTDDQVNNLVRSIIQEKLATFDHETSLVVSLLLFIQIAKANSAYSLDTIMNMVRQAWQKTGKMSRIIRPNSN